ncbi:MAG: hypothetical protein NC301_01000 [Bacteroides sp.]|nr:hypothetical protein [Bacteroides sp.]MCM1378810.1 hypothetical protein [Bacteroides sp.]MCM1445427.1 hypothetical protein [Prevotella sp.]
MASASTEVSLEGVQITNATVSTAFTDGTVISLQCLDNHGGAGYYFAGAAVKTQTLTEANLFVVRVQDDGTFVLQSYTSNQYVGSTGNSFSSGSVSMKDDIAYAAKFTADIASADNWSNSDKWSVVVNGTNTIRLSTHTGNNVAGYLNTNNETSIPQYTGTDRNGGYSVWYVFTHEVIDTTFPMEGQWYRFVNKEDSGNREGNYLGYYPVNPWYIFKWSDATRTEKITQPTVSSGNVAHLSAGATEADIDGQLWQLIAGEGANAGKYCVVNKAYPNGAISNIVANNAGGVQAAADKTSRYIYTFDRAAKPDSVAWFDLTIGTDDYITLGQGTNFLSVAGTGQNYQIHRCELNNASYWMPERYVEETYDPQAVFDARVAELKGIARGCAKMKAVIGGEDCPVVTMPEGTTGLTMDEAVAAANAQYAAYIAKFNNKFVTIYNNRRASGTGSYTANNPWLAIYINAAGNVVINSRTAEQKNDDCIWLMKVDNNKLRFYNRTTGYQLKDQLLIPSAVSTGVMLKIDGSANYIHLSGTTGNLMDYNDAEDPGSVWTIEPASFTFCEPQVSTKENPRYYRILSDRKIVMGQNANLSVNGETRTNASGPGENVSASTLAQAGIYWRLEQAGNGSVKIFNLIDGYAMKGDALTMSEAEDATEVYLYRLNETSYGTDTDNFSIANTYGIAKGSDNFNYALNLGGNGEFYFTNYSPIGDGRDNLDLTTTNGNGALWYFIEANDTEIEHAKTTYITAVKNNIGALRAIDNSESLAALSMNNAAVKDYAALVAEHNAAYDALTTIESVNNSKRNGIVNNFEAITAEVDSILDKYIVGQHVQLWTNKESASGWSVRYMHDNGTKIAGIADATDYSTLWTIEKVDDGYIIVNEKSGKAIGTPGLNINMVDRESAQVYNLVYNNFIGRFAITRTGYASNSPGGSIHMSQSGGTIVNWSADGSADPNGIENSHWGISALDDVEYSLSYDSQEGLTMTLSGALHEAVADDEVIVRVIPMTSEEEEALSSAKVKSRVALEDGSCEFTAKELRDGNYVVTMGELTVGKNYKLEVAGAKMTTADGTHTRALKSSFVIDQDGTVNGIDEVGAAPASKYAEGIYDLTGRRLNAPVRGINIINGRKVLVK